MSGEEVRNQLAEAVPHADWCHERDRELGGPCVCEHDRLDTADALLPVVERIAKERAADEIRALAHRLDDNGDEAIEVALGGAAYVHRVLCDTAHALDGKP